MMSVYSVISVLLRTMNMSDMYFKYILENGSLGKEKKIPVKNWKIQIFFDFQVWSLQSAIRVRNWGEEAFQAGALGQTTPTAQSTFPSTTQKA